MKVILPLFNSFLLYIIPMIELSFMLEYVYNVFVKVGMVSNDEDRRDY